MIYRRQRQQFVFAIFLAVIAVVNVLFYFILMRPSQKEYANLQESISELQKSIKNGEQGLTKLKEQSKNLDQFGPTKEQLLNEHMIPRKQGYYEVIETLNNIAVKTGVRKTRVSYNLNPTLPAGFNPLSITIPVEGNYGQVVSFIRELEESKTFYLITSISAEGTAQPLAGTTRPPGQIAIVANPPATGGAGAVALSLSLETYFYQ
jgi:Tfp pilus assembly protein PilO